jgi:hypothetical protein
LSVGLACLRVIRLKIEILLLSYYHRTAIAFTNVTTPDKQCKNHNRMHLSACGYVMSFRKPETLVRGVCPPEFSDTYGCCCSAFFLFGRSSSPVVERLGCAVRAGRGTVGRHVERGQHMEPRASLLVRSRRAERCQKSPPMDFVLYSAIARNAHAVPAHESTARATSPPVLARVTIMAVCLPPRAWLCLVAEFGVPNLL